MVTGSGSYAANTNCPDRSWRSKQVSAWPRSPAPRDIPPVSRRSSTLSHLDAALGQDRGRLLANAGNKVRI